MPRKSSPPGSGGLLRRPPLTREAILDAALAILDRDGLDGLSMRKVGQALGVEAMSLYNHVENKEALLDGIHERILVSLEAPGSVRTWQSFVRHQAHALHAALVAHPHAIPLFATRPAATRESIDVLGRYLDVLTEAGFSAVEALSIVQLVAQLVVGHAMWTTSVEIVIAPESAERFGKALERWDPDRELEMGIDALVYGFERRLG